MQLAIDRGPASDCLNRDESRTCITTWRDDASMYCTACVREQWQALTRKLHEARGIAEGYRDLVGEDVLPWD